MTPRMLRSVPFALAFLGASAVLVAPRAENSEAENAVLATSLKDVKLSLESGLATSEREGKPISAKFELDEGKLQLSAYTTKPEGFIEVVIDPKTGGIAKAKRITDASDLAAAASQKAAIERAKISLSAATETAVKASAGFRAVSVTPKLADGHPVAEVVLLQGATYKNVIQRLD
jgi:hypothetical protein